jgi:hypothetical protein
LWLGGIFVELRLGGSSGFAGRRIGGGERFDCGVLQDLGLEVNHEASVLLADLGLEMNHETSVLLAETHISHENFLVFLV